MTTTALPLRRCFALAARLGVRGRTIAAIVAAAIGTFAAESVALAFILAGVQRVFEGEAGAGQLSRMVEAVHRALGFEPSLAGIGAIAAAAIGLRQALSFQRQILALRAAEDLALTARRQAFSAFLLSRSSVQTEHERGRLVSDLTLELDRARVAIASACGVLLATAIFAVYGATLLALSWKLTALALPVLAAGLLPLVAVNRASGAAGVAASRANDDMVAFLVARLASTRLIRLAGAVDAERASLATLVERQRGAVVGFGRLLAWATILVEPIALAIAVGLVFAGRAWFGMANEEVGLFLVIVMRLAPAAKELAHSRQLLVGHIPSLERVTSRIAEFEAAREDPGGGRRFAGLAKELRFDAVTVRYPGAARAALDGVSLVIPAGLITALVGPSGAGKTTLVDLVPRIVDPDSGIVTADGVALREFDLAGLRAGIAFVPQRPLLLGATIAEHVAYGQPDLPRAEIERAIDLTGLRATVDALPAGTASPIGEHGSRLSGGQAQRLEIARALARRARILILDEPTSALDADSEDVVVDVIRRLRREAGCTIVVIAHRLSTVREADQIVVMNDGRVEAAGPPATLAHGPNWYAQALRRQGLTAPPALVAASS